MAKTIPGYFTELGFGGETDFSYQGKIKASDILHLIRNANQCLSEVGRRWWWNFVPSGGQDISEVRALKVEDTDWVRVHWTLGTFAKGRRRLQLQFEFEKGSMRFRYKEMPSGAWSSYVTSSAHTTRARWSPSELVLTPGGSYQFEIEAKATSASTPPDPEDYTPGSLGYDLNYPTDERFRLYASVAWEANMTEADLDLLS